MEIPCKPFTIIAVGSFAPVPEGPINMKIIPVDTTNDALTTLRPAVWIPVAKEICPEGGVGITPERIKDLTPQGMAGSIMYLKDLSDVRELIGRSSGLSPENVAQAVREKWPNLPLELKIGRSKAGTEQNRVNDILSMVAMSGQSNHVNSGDTEGLKGFIAEIDRLMSGVLTAVFSDETFRGLEAAWRGIDLIIKQGPAGGAKDTRLAIVNTSREKLSETLGQLSESCENDPPDLILVDFLLDNSPVAMELADELASFAEDLIAPVIINASARFLGLEDWMGIDHLPLVAHHIEDNPVYAKWLKLRKDPRANWLAAACNSVFVRQAYGQEPAMRGVTLEEDVAPSIHPVWAIGTLAAQSVSLCGWPSRLVDTHDIELGGLALHTFADGIQASTEAVFTVDRLRQLADIGLTALAGTAMKDTAFLPAARVISGESLPFQMFLSRITGFLIRLRQENGASIPSDDAASWLSQVFQALFRLSGGHSPDDLSITATVNEGRLIFEISLTPPAAILSGTRRITFTFAW